MRRKPVISRLIFSLLIISFFLVLISAPQAREAIQNPSKFENVQYFVKGAGKEKAEPVKGQLIFDTDSKSVRFTGKQTQLDIPYSQITGLMYEKTAKPRYALGLLVAWPLLFTKSKGHYLTIQYKKAEGEGQFALMRLDKENYQMALATAESQTGVKLQRVEEK